MQVLLIEPDRFLAKAYNEALEAQGHTVTWVPSAEGGIHAADSTKPDCVVLALNMARHNGIEFLYEFKSYPEWQAVPVVLLIPRVEYDLGDTKILRSQLGVRTVLVRSQTTLAQLCEAVNIAGQDGV